MPPVAALRSPPPGKPDVSRVVDSGKPKNNEFSADTASSDQDRDDETSDENDGGVFARSDERWREKHTSDLQGVPFKGSAPSSFLQLHHAVQDEDIVIATGRGPLQESPSSHDSKGFADNSSEEFVPSSEFHSEQELFSSEELPGVPRSDSDDVDEEHYDELPLFDHHDEQEPRSFPSITHDGKQEHHHDVSDDLDEEEWDARLLAAARTAREVEVPMNYSIKFPPKAKSNWISNCKPKLNLRAKMRYEMQFPGRYDVDFRFLFLLWIWLQVYN